MTTIPPPPTPDQIASFAGPWHGPIPHGTTHAAYCKPGLMQIVPFSYVDDFKDFTGGTLRFGKLRYGEDFISLMPGEEGEKIDENSCGYWELSYSSKNANVEPMGNFSSNDGPRFVFEFGKSNVGHSYAAPFVPPPAAGHYYGDLKTGLVHPVKPYNPPPPLPANALIVDKSRSTGGKMAAIVEACEALFKSTGVIPKAADVLAALPPGFNKASVAVAVSNWKKTKQ